jgi:GNAT superfamily N-acetyltransferase
LRCSARSTIVHHSRAAWSRLIDISECRRDRTRARTWQRLSCWCAAGGLVAGFYTLSSTAVNVDEWPAQTVRKLPRYPLISATPLGRLAIDRRRQGRGYGRHLLADALFRAISSEIASFAVIVDAKDENARSFYERESFLPFPDRPMKLFRPIADIGAIQINMAWKGRASRSLKPWRRRSMRAASIAIAAIQAQQDAFPCRFSARPPRHVSLLNIDRGDLDVVPVQPQVELCGAGFSQTDFNHHRQCEQGRRGHEPQRRSAIVRCSASRIWLVERDRHNGQCVYHH